MKTKKIYPLLILAILVIALSACQKGLNTRPDSTSLSTSSLVASTGAIAIGTTASLASSSSTTAKDSIYVIKCYPLRGKKDSVAFSSLPSSIGTYLTANYAGYTFKKAYAISDSTKTIINYVVIIKYNNNLVGLKFTASGTFVSVLEQRGGADLGGPGWHPGGPFDNRGGNRPDTIALSAIPTVVKTFFTTNYAADTLLHAGIAPDGTYVLISKNKTLFATAITPTGTLVKRAEIDDRPGTHTAIAQANLPAAVSTYLTATYSGYVFDKAFTDSNKSGIVGYTVFITSNSTKYAVQFNASGVFVKVCVVR